MAEREARHVRCPFCGAPYRNLIQANALQLKCEYCGATFHTPPRIGVEIPQCANHPDRFAVGICNDCGRNFCSGCLEIYDFKTRDGRATLHLCRECRHKRDIGKANSYILAGTFMLVLGFLFAIIFWPIGAFLIAVGVIEIVYGAGQREPAQAVSDETEVLKEEELVTTPEAELERTDMMYDELLSRYVEHWGVPTGPQLLENEIRAYTWHGDSFEEAVAKVHRRQRKKR